MPAKSRNSTVVRHPGLEPGRACAQSILNRSRLPLRQWRTGFGRRGCIDKPMTNRNYTEADFREAVAASLSIHQTLVKLGLCAQGGSYRTFHQAVKRWNIDSSHFTGQLWNKGTKPGPLVPIEHYFSGAAHTTSHRLRLKLLATGTFPHRCDICRLTEWLEKPIPLELDHIDGCHDNNQKENLRLLCPNCHTQTPTYGSKKRNGGSGEI